MQTLKIMILSEMIGYDHKISRYCDFGIKKEPSPELTLASE